MDMNELSQKVSSLKGIYDSVIALSPDTEDIDKQKDVLKLLRLAIYAAVKSFIDSNYDQSITLTDKV